MQGSALSAAMLPAQRRRRADLTFVKVCQCKARKIARLKSKVARNSMKARDIMTSDVVTVGPETSVRDIAALMAEKHISGVPVLDHNGTIIGIVSETDLLHRAELGTEPERKRKWWLDFNALAREYGKAYGLRAGVVMSRCVVAVHDDAELRDVADVLDRHRFKRVPVLQGGRLVGIITRGDLVRALSQAQVGESTKRTPDAALHKTLRSRIRTQPWMNESYITVAVNDGVVDLCGFVKTLDQHNALRALVDGTEGVRGVDDKVVVGAPSKGKRRLTRASRR
jgi:CBS domain-containing protein